MTAGAARLSFESSAVAASIQLVNTLFEDDDEHEDEYD
jgi:hypothetical protein